jgi:hypothetical protein
VDRLSDGASSGIVVNGCHPALASMASVTTGRSLPGDGEGFGTDFGIVVVPGPCLAF